MCDIGAGEWRHRMISASDIGGMMAMMPAFATDAAADLAVIDTVSVERLRAGLDRMVSDGANVIATTGSFGECHTLLPDEFRTEANRVHGCQSTVYLTARRRPGTADVLEFLADSDADIVRGLIAVLQRVFSGQRAADILAFDTPGFWRRLGLDRNLSTGRRNGLGAMVERLRGFAKNLAEQGEPV